MSAGLSTESVHQHLSSCKHSLTPSLTRVFTHAGAEVFVPAHINQSIMDNLSVSPRKDDAVFDSWCSSVSILSAPENNSDETHAAQGEGLPSRISSLELEQEVESALLSQQEEFERLERTYQSLLDQLQAQIQESAVELHDKANESLILEAEVARLKAENAQQLQESLDRSAMLKKEADEAKQREAILKLENTALNERVINLENESRKCCILS